jgi:hypothetical protein
MKLEEIIFVLENKIKSLEQQRGTAVLNGDLEVIAIIDTQLIETQTSLDSIRNRVL